MKDGYLDFDEYIVASEPHKRERAEAWKVAIGLQAVDGLQVSEYLKQTARRHIEGEITIDEAKELVKQYYVSKTKHDDDEDEKQEADRVSINITKIINERAFTFSTTGLISIHRNLFSGVFKPRGNCATTTSPRKNGCCEATRCCMVAGKTCGWRWIMTSRRRSCSTIKGCRWRR